MIENAVVGDSAQSLIAGVDEAGRGPLAGPVVAAAVILDPKQPIQGLADSKKLSEKQRAKLEVLIHERALCWSIGSADVAEIDKLNILHASLLAMQRAVSLLSRTPHRVLIDGNRCPKLEVPSEAIVKGDQLVDCISAASILAKQHRDRELLALDEIYPGYGFAKHKGYPTKAHLQALDRYGVCAVHRRSYAPVRERLATQT